MRSLLFLAVMAMPMTQVLTQDTVLSRVPQIELIPVLQREVMDHYINKTMTSKGWRLEIFDGRKELVLHFGWEEFVRVSPNQRYFTVARPVASPEGGTMAYDVELRNVSNSVLARGRMSSLGSDGQESHDEFVPADDGLSILHVADLPFSGGLHFVFVKRRANRLVRQFEVDKSELDFWNSRLSYEPKQGMIVASFTGRAAGSGVYQTYLQCYSPEGRLQWETVINGQSALSDIFISGFDGTVALVCQGQSGHNTKKERLPYNLFLFKKGGNLIRELSVYNAGTYQHSYFHIFNGEQYFLSLSDGEFYYVIKTDKGEIVNRNIQGKEGSNVTGVAIFQNKAVITYFRGMDYYPLLSDGIAIGEFVSVKESGLGIEDEQGKFAYVRINSVNIPSLFVSKSDLFLREEIGVYIDQKFKFYKINFKW